MEAMMSMSQKASFNSKSSIYIPIIITNPSTPSTDVDSTIVSAVNDISSLNSSGSSSYECSSSFNSQNINVQYNSQNQPFINFGIISESTNDDPDIINEIQNSTDNGLQQALFNDEAFQKILPITDKNSVKNEINYFGACMIEKSILNQQAKNSNLFYSTPNLSNNEINLNDENNININTNNNNNSFITTLSDTTDSKHMENTNCNTSPLNISECFNPKLNYSINSFNSKCSSLNSIISINSVDIQNTKNLLLLKKTSLPSHRFKLIREGDVYICKLQHSKNVLDKFINSKLLRRWKLHNITLNETQILAKTKSNNNLNDTIFYQNILDISPISKWEPGQKYCLRIATIDCHYLLQTNSLYLRDQWIHSIEWKKHKYKSERILRTVTRSEILIKELDNLINMSLNTPIDDAEISEFPLELISDILQKHELAKDLHEEIMLSLTPLLEKKHPSAEICDFFSKHCRQSPRSHIVIEMFSPVVQRILKHNGDFGRYPRMRLFVQDYLKALMSQNEGLITVQQFICSMHSTSSQCPFPRVLPNIVSVCLASIHGCFENSRIKKTQPCIILTEEEQNDQLICNTTIMHTMSKYEDWRTNLSQLLQSVPFPDLALKHKKFIEIFKNVIKNFAQDPRCEVHQTLLGIREGKEGWFDIFCPDGISCNDSGELFTIMLNTLINCCCKKKRFLLSINKILPHIYRLALNEIPCAIDTLCAMLDLDGLENVERNKEKLINVLQSTNLGLQQYAKVLERQLKLRELQQKGGPRKLTLPSRSTDEDLAKILLSGSFGNLECLSLAFTNVTSACAEYLIKLPSLRYLNLWSTKFGDQGLELISEHLQRLQVLNLCETPVTDKGLSCLASMKQLRKLNLNSTNLSAITFEGLKECLPALQECDIRYTDAW